MKQNKPKWEMQSMLKSYLTKTTGFSSAQTRNVPFSYLSQLALLPFLHVSYQLGFSYFLSPLHNHQKNEKYLSLPSSSLFLLQAIYLYPIPSGRLIAHPSVLFGCPKNSSLLRQSEKEKKKKEGKKKCFHPRGSTHIHFVLIF